MKFRRIVVIVLDGVGVGALPDASHYGDQGAATLPHVADIVDGLNVPLLQRMGLGNIAAIAGVSPTSKPLSCWGKMAEKSAGKDSVSGHWELAGIVLDQPFATFPDGFPEEIVALFVEKTGLNPLGNVAASGTDILRKLGEAHLKSGRPIIYTSSDSVFQIAAHENIIPPAELYDICRSMQGALESWNICRVIARPFLGNNADSFYRTERRHDFAASPPEPMLLDLLLDSGVTTCGVGKIGDLYAGQGLSQSHETGCNADGMERTLSALKEIKNGLIMTNLVDFDMLYGHRRDASGFAQALEAFDAWLPEMFSCLLFDDLVMITADHGCDPTTSGTDHSREYVPLLCYRRNSNAADLGVRTTFADLGATVADNFGVQLNNGNSFLSEL